MPEPGLASEPADTVESIKASRRSGWYSLILSSGERVKINDDCILQFHLAAGMSIDADLLGKIKAFAQAQAFRSKFIGWAGLRTRSSKETSSYLRKNNIDAGELDKYLSLAQTVSGGDTDFASSRARHRRRQFKSDRIIRLELQSQGIASDDVDTAIDNLEQGEEWAINQLLRSKLRSKPKDKALAYLLRQGFNYNLVKDLMAEG